ncbi:MAG: hypothetical protein M3450_14550 [Actinomycetota bacterium]|nr:hypothetical protein [Actinomycetota bacterium]
MPLCRLLAAAAVLVLVAMPATAAADSIVYEKDGNIWQAAPDGTSDDSRRVRASHAGRRRDDHRR